MSEYGRQVRVEAFIDIWDWTNGTIKSTIDVTKSLMNYRFQKSIKSPAGSCQIMLVPQLAAVHILDVVSPLDVVTIKEFGVTKFIGYVVRVSYSGTINQDGTPSRSAVLTVSQFGGLLQEATVGFGLGTILGKQSSELFTQANKLFTAVGNAVSSGSSTYAHLFKILADNFMDFLTGIGAQKFLTYLQTYLDYSTGLTSNIKPQIPRQFDLYAGTETQLHFWEVAEKLVQRPFNELWVDNGPRKVTIDGSDVTLPEKNCIVFRETPFDGTVGGQSTSVFSSLPTITVPKGHLIRFDLSRGMDEVYTVYSVKNPAFQFNDYARLLLGLYAKDPDRVGKYLFRLFSSELFFIQPEKTIDTGEAIAASKIETIGQQYADTALAWFKNNDQYFSGAITMMVPTDPDKDPKIGQKIEVEGLDGYFYAEGIAHTWQYQGQLSTTLSVTRGYNRTKKMEFKDKIFRRNRIR